MTNSWRTTPLPPHWDKLRTHVWNTRQHKCNHCGGQLYKTTTQQHSGFHLDHIIPAMNGGTDNLNNLQLLCTTCHHKKTTKETQNGYQRAKTRSRTLIKQTTQQHPYYTSNQHNPIYPHTTHKPHPPPNPTNQTPHGG